MSTESFSLDLRRTMGAAEHAAISVCGRRWAHWVEDVAQEVALAVVLQARRGQRIGRRGYWYYASSALRSIVGHRGRRDSAVEITPEIERSDAMAVRPSSPSAMLAVWRLQREWPSMGRTQREAIGLVLTGGYGDSVDVRARLGVTQQALHAAKKAAVGRLDCRC